MLRALCLGWLQVIAVPLAIFFLLPSGDTRMAQAPRPVYQAPEPDAEIDAECPNCGETWHLKFYRDMPMQKVYSLRPGQTWEMLLNHMRYCERSIGRMLHA